MLKKNAELFQDNDRYEGMLSSVVHVFVYVIFHISSELIVFL